MKELGDDQARQYAKDAIDLFISGGINRKDGDGTRSLGGTFFRIAKDDLK